MRIKLIAACLLAGVQGIAMAQKLPASQKTGVWLPALSKADGKLDEWNNVLQARNHSTMLEYTMANDDDVLYFAAQSTDKFVNDRIMAGGVTLLINLSGKEKDPNNPAITFPVREIYRTSKDPFGHPSYVRNVIYLDSAAMKNVILHLKEIKIAGIKGVTDPTLPLFNDEGIKAKVAYANNTLTYELVAPLALLKLTPGQKFEYKVTINGVPDPPASNPDAPPPPMFIGVNSQASADEMSSTTNFSGTYIPAQKPVVPQFDDH
jgi:hypothetical protein